jgi:hypothetical protein
MRAADRIVAVVDDDGRTKVLLEKWNIQFVPKEHRNYDTTVVEVAVMVMKVVGSQNSPPYLLSRSLETVETMKYVND